MAGLHKNGKTGPPFLGAGSFDTICTTEFQKPVLVKEHYHPAVAERNKYNSISLK